MNKTLLGIATVVALSVGFTTAVAFAASSPYDRAAETRGPV
ncbi:hypothetical protein [Alicyclobacillus sp. SP_1]|nr:hypothetical protein [Alicyclobacillus sp. SP_1]